MAKYKTPGDEICGWLKVNGFHLGGLTGQDLPALRAAAEILACYSKSDSAAEPQLLTAFRCVVIVMQPSMRHLAYHAIAFAMDWGARPKIWQIAGLPPLDNPGRATHE